MLSCEEKLALRHFEGPCDVKADGVEGDISHDTRAIKVAN